MDLIDLIEREIDHYLEWPTADKSRVTTVSAKLFAEHVARLYADHIHDAGRMVPKGWKLVPVEPTLEMIAAMGFEGCMDTALGHAELCAKIEEYYCAMLAAAPAVQGEPVGEVRFELGAPSSIYAEQQPDAALLVEALEEIVQWVERWADASHPVAVVARKALDKYRKGGEA